MNKSKLADLMRKGARLVPQQVFGGFFIYDEEGVVVKACALGAAIIAEDEKWQQRSLAASPLFGTQVMVYVDNVKDTHPITGRYQTLYDIITNLHDDLHWTREIVADWLERGKP